MSKIYINYYGISDKGKIRENNEDYFVSREINKNEYIFAVADGMGGHPSGEIASKSACEILLRDFLKKENKDITESFKRTFGKINQFLIYEGDSVDTLQGMGTTLSVVYIKDRMVHIAHVGDSRVYLLSGKEIKRLTEDHSFVGKMIKNGMISEENAKNHPKKNILYQAMGTKYDIKVQILKPFEIKRDDKILLCTDGLTDMVSEDKIQNILLENSAKDSVNKLIKEALKSGGGDNITCIVVEAEKKKTKKAKSDNEGKKLSFFKNIKFRIRIKKNLFILFFAFMFLFLIILSGIFYIERNKLRKEIFGVEEKAKKIVQIEKKININWDYFLSVDNEYAISSNNILFKKDEEFFNKNFSGKKPKAFDTKIRLKNFHLVKISENPCFYNNQLMIIIKDDKIGKRDLIMPGKIVYFLNNWIFSQKKNDLIIYKANSKENVYFLPGVGKFFIFKNRLINFKMNEYNLKTLTLHGLIPESYSLKDLRVKYVSQYKKVIIQWYNKFLRINNKTIHYLNEERDISFKRIFPSPDYKYFIGETETKELYILKAEKIYNKFDKISEN